jgi:hypothetical protein
LFFTSCRKDLLDGLPLQQIKLGTNKQLNTRLFLTNGIGIMDVGSRLSSVKLFISIDQCLSWQAKQKAFWFLCSAMARSFFYDLALNICTCKDTLNNFTLA